MKKLTPNEIDILNNMLEKKKNSLIDSYRKAAAQINNIFSKFSTFFATSDPGYLKARKSS